MNGLAKLDLCALLPIVLLPIPPLIVLLEFAFWGPWLINPVEAWVLKVPRASPDAAVANLFPIGDLRVLLGDILEKRDALPRF